ncbi:16S rRNA (cytidine(1402)-2'-O)-methyltransferase [Candidatus Aerophobetes bacterium]|uniref:Ribosomal RNA small subunit methyltransferase I n=1 Tax=Aerophobetes bacterium TaxID=2030807 RepID=A0A662D3E9_UNCAE|nr:MAG: 16S rRNA (cytidine(1402)-2'-O)-methyltransferase [Candidatus Aerophobetes bacterium]
MNKGVLYPVGTPIGNLKDITLRALEILKEVDLIASEDTRHTRKLLSHYDIHTSLTSFYEHNQLKKTPYLIDCLKKGKNVALVSKAGMPGISDPGYYLIKEAVKEKIKIVPIPGPTALAIALVASGLPMDNFVFEGFLGRRKSERMKKLKKLREEERTIIIYEAPHRLKKTLEEIREVLGDRRIAVGRELTKKFEEIIRGRVSEAENIFKERTPRGEFTLVIEGKAPHLS